MIGVFASMPWHYGFVASIRWTFGTRIQYFSCSVAAWRLFRSLGEVFDEFTRSDDTTT